MRDKHELLTFINAFLTDRHHSEETLSGLTADVFRLAKDCLEAEPVAYYFPGSDIESQQLGFPWELDEEQMANCIELIAR